MIFLSLAYKNGMCVYSLFLKDFKLLSMIFLWKFVIFSQLFKNSFNGSFTRRVSSFLSKQVCVSSFLQKYIFVKLLPMVFLKHFHDTSFDDKLLR